MISAHAMMGSASDASTPPGQNVWTGTTSASWTVPAGVTSICILTVGAGFAGTGAGVGGGGGALSYANTVSVTPGEVLDIRIDGTRSDVRRSTTKLCSAYAICALQTSNT